MTNRKRNQIIGEVASISKKIETLLKDNFHKVNGKGLHDKITCVERQLENKLIKKLRYIATIRNKTIHEDDFFPESKFINTARETVKELEVIIKDRNKATKGIKGLFNKLFGMKLS